MLGFNKSINVILFFSVLIFFACLGNVSAVDFNSAATSQDLQSFIYDTNVQDDIINLQAGNYSFKNLNITRKLTIQAKGNDVVNIKGDGNSTLFNVKSQNVVIKNLNIIDYGVAINSTSDKLTITGNKITYTYVIYNITGIIINVTGNDIVYNNDNLIENNIINTTLNSIVLDVESSSAKKTYVENNIIKNNTISSWLDNAIYSDTKATFVDFVLVDNYLKSIGNTVIYISTDSLTRFTFKNNTVRSDSETTKIIDIRFKNTIKNIEISRNNILSTSPITGITISSTDSSINSNITNIIITNNSILTNGNSIVLSPNGKIENFNLTNNDLSPVTLTGAYVSNFNISKNNLTKSGIHIITTKCTNDFAGIDNLTAENNKFKGGNAIYIGSGEKDIILNNISYNNILINNNTGDMGGGEFFVHIRTANGDWNNLTISNNNITGSLGYIAPGDSLGYGLNNFTGLFILNNTAATLQIYINLNVSDTQISNNTFLGNLHYAVYGYVGGLLDLSSNSAGNIVITLTNIPEKFVLSGASNYDSLTLGINSQDHETEIQIIDATINSLTINIASKAYINITNSTISSLTITDSTSQSQIYITNNTISKLSLRFTSNSPNVYVVNNVIGPSGALLGFDANVDAKNITFKNNKITGTIGLEIYNIGITQGTVRNLNISDNIINVSGTGILIDGTGKYDNGNSKTYDFDNITIINNIITSDADGIKFNIQVGTSNPTIIETMSNILIEGNIINAVNNGICYAIGLSATRGINVKNNIIVNNIIYAGQTGILVNARELTNFIVLSNDIKSNGNGIHITIPANAACILSDISVNYNSIVANGYLLYLSKAATGTNNIDYNWWGSNNIDPNKLNIYTLTMNNHYNVTLDNNGASGVGDSVISKVILDDGTNLGVDKLPDFYVSIYNNGKIEDILAKGGIIEVLSPGNPHKIKYNKGESDQEINIYIAGKISTILETETFAGVPNEEVTITATLKNGNGAPLLGKLITFTINGVTYQAYTDSNGIATIKYIPGSESNSTIKIEFAGDNDYTGSVFNTYLIAKHRDSTSIDAKNFNTTLMDVINGLVTVSATLKNSAGIGIANKRIIFTIDSINYYGITNANGVATIQFAPGRVGTFTIEINFIEDGIVYKNSSSTITLTVFKNDLQAIIDNIPVGGIVYITEDYKDISVVINKSITIINKGGSITSSLNSPIFIISGSNVIIMGMDLSASNSAAIAINGGSNVRVINCIIHDSHLGINLTNADNVEILNNSFNCFDGIDLYDGLSNVLIKENNISGVGREGATASRETGNGIILNAYIPNLLITKNIITHTRNGLFITYGNGTEPVKLYDAFLYNVIYDCGFSIDLPGALRSTTTEYGTGPNYFGGVSAFVCPGIINFATMIYADLISVDNQGTFLVYFYYIDKNGNKVNVTELPNIMVTFSLNNIGSDQVLTKDSRAIIDYSDRIFNNPNGITVYAYVGDQKLSITLNREEIVAGIEEAIRKGIRNPDGSVKTNTSNNNTNNSNTNPNDNSPGSNNNGSGNDGLGSNTGGTGNNPGSSNTGGTGNNPGSSNTGGTGNNPGSSNTGGTGNNPGSSNTGIISGNVQGNSKSNNAVDSGYNRVGVTASASSSVGGESDGSGDNPDAYEITPKDQTSEINNNTVIITIILIVAVLGLIVVGIVRRRRFV